MGPNSLEPMDIQRKPLSPWLVAVMVFIAGLGAGVLIPVGMNYLGLGETKVASMKQESATASADTKIRRMDPPLSHQPAAPVQASAVEKIEKPKQKLAAVAFREGSRKNKKTEKTAAKLEKVAAVKEKGKEEIPPAAKAEKASPADLIEKVPSALTANQVDRLLQSSSVAMARTNGKALAKPVALPPSQALVPTPALSQNAGTLPILKTDPRSESKTYPVSINNASFSKTTLSSCSKRCALLGMDAMGNPIRAIIDGPTYAAALLQHNGTINISGQPRIVKNQQVLLVENITFNLSSSAKTASKRARPSVSAAPTTAEERNAGYTEVSFEGDDLKPGTVIKNRKQIPIEDQQEIPTP